MVTACSLKFVWNCTGVNLSFFLGFFCDRSDHRVGPFFVRFVRMWTFRAIMRRTSTFRKSLQTRSPHPLVCLKSSARCSVRIIPTPVPGADSVINLSTTLTAVVTLKCKWTIWKVSIRLHGIFVQVFGPQLLPKLEYSERLIHFMRCRGWCGLDPNPVHHTTCTVCQMTLNYMIPTTNAFVRNVSVH